MGLIISTQLKLMLLAHGPHFEYKVMESFLYFILFFQLY